MKKKEVESLFILAGIKVLNIKPLIDGYGPDPEYEGFYKTPPRCAWWFVKTESGWIEIGWRKRVININWEDTQVRKVITDDNVTKDFTYVHACSIEKAIEYLKALAVVLPVTKTTNPNLDL